MRILFSTLEDLSRPGAERTHIVELVRNLAYRGHRVIVLCHGGERELSKLHKNVIGIKVSLHYSRLLPLFLNRKIQKYYLRKQIIGSISGVDVVYERDNTFNVATEIGKKRGIATFVEVNGVASLEAKMQGADPQTVARIEEQTLEKLKVPDKLVVVAEGIKEHFVQLGISEEKFLVVPNGVNTKIFRPMNTMECRKALGLSNSPLLTFVGAFRVYQGLEYAIRALPAVLRYFPEAKLVLVGDSEIKDGFQFRPTRQDLEVLGSKLGVLEHLIFTGFVPQERVALYINASDVCIAPTMQATSGLSFKLFEYMACGKPVVVFFARDTNDIAKKSGEAILTARPADPEDLSQKIVTLLTDHKRRGIMGERALRFVRSNHDWRIISQRILNEMEKIVSTDAHAFVRNLGQGISKPLREEQT